MDPHSGPRQQLSAREASRNFRIQGWDPALLISQIVTLQTLHYLVLSLLLPPMLSFFSSPEPLMYEGGPFNIAFLMDWREMAGRDTVSREPGYSALPRGLGRERTRMGWGGGWNDEEGYDNSRDWKVMIGKAWKEESGSDSGKGWAVALAWLIVSVFDILHLYHFVRRPTRILDHALTLLSIHLILTTYYSSSIPTSLFVWLVFGLSTSVQVVWTEHLCVRREMREGFEGIKGVGSDVVVGDRVMNGMGEDETKWERLVRRWRRGVRGVGWL